MALPQVYEGTLEEIAEQLRTAGRTRQHFKVIVVPEDGDEAHFYDTASEAEWEEAMDALAQGGETLPILPPEAYDRENIYDERQ